MDMPRHFHVVFDVDVLKLNRSILTRCLTPQNLSPHSAMDDLHVRLTFNIGKTNKIFYYSLKEHPKISRIAKFGGEML